MELLSKDYGELPVGSLVEIFNPYNNVNKKKKLVNKTPSVHNMILAMDTKILAMTWTDSVEKFISLSAPPKVEIYTESALDFIKLSYGTVGTIILSDFYFNSGVINSMSLKFNMVLIGMKLCIIKRPYLRIFSKK